MRGGKTFPIVITQNPYSGDSVEAQVQESFHLGGLLAKRKNYFRGERYWFKRNGPIVFCPKLCPKNGEIEQQWSSDC